MIKPLYKPSCFGYQTHVFFAVGTSRGAVCVECDTAWRGTSLSRGIGCFKLETLVFPWLLLDSKDSNWKIRGYFSRYIERSCINLTDIYGSFSHLYIMWVKQYLFNPIYIIVLPVLNRICGKKLNPLGMWIRWMIPEVNSLIPCRCIIPTDAWWILSRDRRKPFHVLKKDASMMLPPYFPAVQLLYPFGCSLSLYIYTHLHHKPIPSPWLSH